MLKKFNIHGAISAINRKMSFPIKIALILSILAGGTALAASISLSDGEWIGLGASAGRIEFNDLATDEIHIESAILNANSELQIGEDDTYSGIFRIFGHAASSTAGGYAALYTAADHDAVFNSWELKVVEDDLQIVSSDGVASHAFNYGEGVVLNEAGTATQDFRVESDTEPNQLVMNAGTNDVIVGHSAPPQSTYYGRGLWVVRDSTADWGIYAYGGANTSTRLAVQGGTPGSETATVSGQLAQVILQGHDGTFFTGKQAGLEFKATQNWTSSNRGAEVNVYNTSDNSSSSVERASFASGEAVFNDPGANYDFRVEGDTEPELLVVNAGDDSVKVDGLFGVGDYSLLTISSGEITVTHSVHTLRPESGVADNLDVINGGEAGDILVLMNNRPADTITVVDDYIDGLVLAGDFSLTYAQGERETITLLCITTDYWIEISRSDNK